MDTDELKKREKLASAVEDERQKQTIILETIRRRRFTPPPNTPKSIELLREDRRR